MNSPPQFSMVMAVHNGMPFLPATMEAVWRQTFREFEVIVVNDGSTDKTASYLESLADSRLRVEHLDKVGVAQARNRGLELAKAPWIAALDADDVPYMSWLEEQHTTVHGDGSLVLCGCQTDLIDEAGEIVGNRQYPTAEDAIRWQMALGAPISHSGSVFRRSAALKLGGYRDEYVPAEDYEFWTRLAAEGRVGNHFGSLMQYRVHAGSVTSTRLEKQIERCGRIAASYAKRLSPAADEEALAELYHFLASGREPANAGYDDLVRAYRQFKHDFLEQVEQPSDELSERIALVQRDLRWSCLEQAEKRWLRPWQAWTWLRRAGRFDPENGTLGSILGRKLRKIFFKTPSPSGRGSG